VSAGKIAEYAVGILVPLGMFWQRNGAGFGLSTSGPKPGTRRSRRGFREAEEKGALPPLRSPFSNLAHHSVRGGLPPASQGVGKLSGRGGRGSAPAPGWALGHHASCRSGKKSCVVAILSCRSILKIGFSNGPHSVGQ
jgi:hypothetical protein